MQTYDLLATYVVRVTKKEQGCMDAMSVKWGELAALARQTMQHLRRIGLTFRVMLLQNMGDFMAASVVFKEDYDREGPMVRGINPSVAEERLKAFQKQYSGASSRASPGRGSRRSRSSTAGSSGRRRSTRWGRT